jgi:H+/Cl- antiporter ClcA
MREILTASSTAGVAVPFGAPVGGVLSSIEEMSGTLRARTLGSAFAYALTRLPHWPQSTIFRQASSYSSKLSMTGIGTTSKSYMVLGIFGIHIFPR